MSTNRRTDKEIMEKPGQWDDIQKERKINHLNKQQHE
jgi:hypothetical protein